MQRTSGSEAFGRPGIELKWTHGGTDAVGTAYAASSHIWFTFWNGILTEAYYPTVDRPQIRDLQNLVTGGKVELLSAHALGYRCTNSDPAGRYAIVKTVIADPHYACILQAHPNHR